MRASPRLEGGGGPLRLCLRRVIVGGAGGVGANVAVAAGVRLALVVVGVATGSGFDRPGHALQGAPLGGIRYLRPVRRRGWSASLWPVSTAHVAHDAPSEIAADGAHLLMRLRGAAAGQNWTRVLRPTTGAP